MQANLFLPSINSHATSLRGIHCQPCDVPLRAYFWLVSIQLMLDIFRADIMKRLCRWRPDSHNPVPARVILYNIGYVRSFNVLVSSIEMKMRVRLFSHP